MKRQRLQDTSFFMLTPGVRDRLLEINLTAAEWRVWCYLVSLDPFGDRGAKFSPAELMLKCSIKKTTYFATKAKFQKLGLFDFRDGVTKVVNLQTSLEKSANSDHSQQAEIIESEISESESEISESESEISESESEISESESEISESQSLKPLSCKASKKPQTLQTYSDFKRSLSERERENFFSFVKEKTNNLEKPINDLEAWLASKNAAKQNRWEIYYKNYQEEKIGQSAKANKHNQDLASSTLAQQKQALHKFHERLKRNSNSHEPEDNNSEEYQPSLAELNQLLNNPPEFGSSLFKKKAAEEAAKRQARLEQLEQETLLLMADPERLDSLLEEDQRLRRQIDARNSKDESEDLSVLQETEPELYRALNPERNPEINPEDLENE